MANPAANPEPDAPRHLPGARAAGLLPLPLAGAYDYRVPEGLTLADGDFVAVPLGRREATGVVWGEGRGSVADAKLKDVIGRLDCPPLPAVSRKFVDWVSRYTLSPPGAVLKMTMSVPDALKPPKAVTAYSARPEPPAIRRKGARERVGGALAPGAPHGVLGVRVRVSRTDGVDLSLS